MAKARARASAEEAVVDGEESVAQDFPPETAGDVAAPEVIENAPSEDYNRREGMEVGTVLQTDPTRREETIITPKKVPGEKPTDMVDVRFKRDVNNHIGGKWYRYKAGNTAKLPRSVKDVFRNAGALDVF